MFPGKTVLLKAAAHIGHGAIIHGGTIGRNTMIGMNSVIMDDVIIGDECIVGALSFVNAHTTIPSRSLLLGNPAKIIKEVSDEMITWKTKGTQLYQQLPADCHESLIACEALKEMPADRPAQETLYATWEEIKGQ
jgi:carbonic anhydrase/acetyltransferase-like protein (isoleucine patch superfamily)